MESTLAKYAGRIEQNEVNPHVRYDGRASALIFDQGQENCPLEVLAFGIHRLEPQFAFRETNEKEVVLVPQEGDFEAEIKIGRASCRERV